jgi:hypothetical protein
MKSLPTLLALLVLSTCVFAADLPRMLSEAQTAMIRGDLETAKRDFEFVNKVDPRNPVAIAGLRQIAIQEAKDGKSGAAEKQLSTVILPQIQFREATFTEALDFLKKKVTEVSGGKQAANFVVQPGVDQSAKITLSLSNIPLTEALRYIAELVNAKVDYQKYAIVIRPASGITNVTQPAPEVK